MTVRPLLTSLPPATCCFSGGLSVVGSWVGGLSPASRQHTSGWSLLLTAAASASAYAVNAGF